MHSACPASTSSSLSLPLAGPSATTAPFPQDGAPFDPDVSSGRREYEERFTVCKGPSAPFHDCYPCFSEEGIGHLYRLVQYVRPEEEKNGLANCVPNADRVDVESNVAPAVLDRELLPESLHEGRDAVLTSGMSQISSYQRWLLYNDTSDVVFGVTAYFSANSRIKALGEASLHSVAVPYHHADAGLSSDAYIPQDAQGYTDEFVQFQATVEVLPGGTVPFVEGLFASFSFVIHSRRVPSTEPSSSFAPEQPTVPLLAPELGKPVDHEEAGVRTPYFAHSESEVIFERGPPSVPYHAIYKCFKDKGNGLLFRLVDEVNPKWYFYNDTRDYLMTVEVDFADPHEVEPIGKTIILWHYAVHEVPPQGVPSHPGEVLPLSNSEAQVIDTGNKAIPKSQYEGGCTFQLSVLPGETAEFIRGAPKVYKLEVIADPFEVPASPPVLGSHGGPTEPLLPAGLLPTEMPLPSAIELNCEISTDKIYQDEHVFRHGKPDPQIIPHLTQIVPCYGDHENGYLFRLVDEGLDIWAFYNDCLNCEITAGIRFPMSLSPSVRLAPGVEVVGPVQEHCMVRQQQPVLDAAGNASNESEVVNIIVEQDVLVASVKIRPLETVPFLVHPPAEFQPIFSISHP